MACAVMFSPLSGSPRSRRLRARRSSIGSRCAMWGSTKRQDPSVDQRPRMARRPSSMSSTKTWGRPPD
jgi:hypothetical protein